MFTGFGQCLEGVRNGGGTGGDRQRSRSVLQRGNALLKDALGRIGQTAVNVACIPETKAVLGMLAVMEHKGCGGVDRDGTGIRDGICLFLTDVELFGFKRPVGGILNI